MAASPRRVADHAPESDAGAAAFWLHAAAWLVFYLTVVVAWGQRNSWPSELILCVLSLPITLLVVSTLFKVERFGFAIQPEKSQQEQLIAALVLAVGLASGQVLLMDLGLVCLGIAWLRPARPGVDWAEWLKMPVLLLTALPFWLDFEGSRLPVATLFDDPLGNPVFHLPLALATTQARVLGYCGLLGLALFLRGRAFWLALPALPVFLAVVTWLPRVIPRWEETDPFLRSAVPWLLGCVGILVLSRIARPLENASRAFVSGATLRHWFAGRRYPPWLAVLVVAVMHALPLETVRFTPGDIIGIAGVAVLVLILLDLRLRTPRGPLHSRSVAMVAGGLALTLFAEFATAEHLRRVALAFALIGLISWHCFWPLRTFVLACATTFLLLAFPDAYPVGIATPSVWLIARLALGFICLAALAWVAQQPLPVPGAQGYGDEGWVPPKRFALILLGLMMLFQTASAFWPEHDMPMPAAHAPADDSGTDDLLAPLEPGWFRVPSPHGAVQVMIALPRKNPYLLESPERTLRRRGWHVVERIRAPHPLGEATALKLERDGNTATAMWWFELGDRAFSNHLYARRILWSGWHLADRRLRLVRLESATLQHPHELIDIARRESWFAGKKWDQDR